MARIPAEQIEKLKNEVSLLNLIESQGYEPVKQGKDYAICCPFHEEKTASLIISPATNLFNCFGCGAAGSVIDWVIKTQGVSFRHAVEILQSDASVLAAPTQPVKRSVTKKLDPLLPENAEAQQLLHQVVDYYHQALKESPEALAYLESRGLNNPELIERFKLGYANRTLGYRLPPKRTKAGDALRGTLQEVGIYRESGHEHFNGSFTVPIFNPGGDVVELYGRKIRDDLRKGTPKHLYLTGPHAGVWNADGLADQKEVILCEALIDAMTFWCAGYRNVTASYGTQGFTDDHLMLFKQCGIERVLIAYDRDEAGNAAAEKLAKRLQKEGFGCYRLNFPKGTDANSYALEVTPASKSLGVVIRSAEWLGEGEEPVLAAESTVDESEPLPPAAAVPDAPGVSVDADVSNREINLVFGDRKYRVRGLEKNKNYEVLKVNVLASNESGLHVDSFDLYSARHRQGFIKVAALELSVEESTLKSDLGKVLLKLEELQEQLIGGGAVEEQSSSSLSDDEKAEALELLRDPELLERILTDFSRCGVVGEEVNKLVGYLAAGSRKLDKPLAVIIQSTSAAGKSSLMDAVLNLMPEDERVQYSAMTGQSLFYMGETNLKHKILAIAEEEGASNASYALKLLQSEGEITIASTGKDDDTGELVTREYRVEGPVMLFLTTTAIDIDEELLNRCLVLTVNESREQTRAIHEAQRRRRTLEGLQAKLEKDRLVTLHRNAQRLLRPLAVINPYADQLTFLDDKTRTRRDHEKYLTLIDSIALLHQYQREVKTINHAGKDLEYVEVQLSDIETANRLAHEVLGRTLDELPAQTRKLLRLIQGMVKEASQAGSIEQRDYRFSRRDVRESVQWSDTALKIHMARLVELEYLLVHRSSRGQSYDYELLYDNSEGDNQQHMMGLIDVKKLQYDNQRSGQNVIRSGSGQPLVRGLSGVDKLLQPSIGEALPESGQKSRKSTSSQKNNSRSYRTDNATPLIAQAGH
ncbi:CHC2 zinc finger domain-containing protein [Porticoccus sp. W117]|uniref:CHC2 zinc finger domain-containing protein n=1 Tax=Porticoccus sp. W117 TaxID=3054777 RepID=UPI00259829F6|nr:CHC2 zinc finger domain-containing protein [Porticoccus sp. W117]MDM3872250.1 CHC2 zinc finger domain-containing protein [Porticoccus sp. W117]MDM3872256.1 CHC2 zinc finger domain-containing protein [Porticoccus sp. W117]